MKIKNICCIGAGYVGGPTMAVIALKCPEIKINVVDTNLKKIRCWNTKDLNKLPVFEPGLSKIISKTRNKNLFFSTKVEKAIDEADMIFMAVNTPTKTSGKGKGMAADLRFVKKCAMQIAKFSSSDKIVVEKSTLPVRTAEKIKDVLKKENKNLNFEVLSNPEFLAEGTAIKDLFKSDRVLIGGDNTESGKIAVNSLVEIYNKWIPLDKIITTNVWSSELSKLASNAMLAQRISSINSLSAFCEKTGAKIDEVSNAVGKDHRIGPYFLKASIGFGGSCFKKDILNLAYLCQYYGLMEVADYWLQVIKINDYQKTRFSKKIIDYMRKNKLKNVAILGWAFKKDTNDSRESAAIDVGFNLLMKGARLTIYDPMVNQNKILNDLTTYFKIKNIDFNKKIKSKIFICSSIDQAINTSDVAAIITEWDQFKDYNWNKLSLIKYYMIFDGRNIIDENIKTKLYKIGN